MRTSDLKFGLLFFIISLALKLPYLGTFLTIDERRWIHGAGQFLLALRAGDLTQTYWHFHPGITITWGEALILYLQSLASSLPLEEFVAFQMENLALSVGAMRLSGVLLTSLALPFLYALARPLMGKWTAILGVGLLAVDPFWVAHSRIVNGDALAGVLMLTAYLAFALLLIKPQLKIALIAGIFVGLSLLTKLPSQILLPSILMLTAIGYFKDRNWRFWLQALFLCYLSTTLVFVLLWPAMWVAPIETLTQIYEDTFAIGDIGGKDKVDFFMGAVVEKQNQLFYPLALLFRLTPITLLGGFISLIILFRHNDKRARYVSLLLWLFIIMVLALANVSPKKADRYVMSVIVAIDLLAGVAWIWLLDQISNRAKGQLAPNSNLFTIHNSQFTIYNLLVLALITPQLIFTITSYPYLLTYYNPLLGGYAKAAELIPVGRGEGLEKAAAWINNQPNAQQATITPYYENVTNYYLAGQSKDWPKDGKKQLLADYVIFYITQTQRQLPYPGLVDYFQNQTPAYVLKQGDTPYVWVYKRQQPIHALKGNAQIIGRAQIVGYSLAQKQLTPHTPTPITLYLLTKEQDLPENEDFTLSLLDRQGNMYGLWQSSANNQWQPNSIVEWHGTLTLPQDLAAGDYKLKVALLDTNTYAEITSFPFEDEFITLE